MAHDEPFSHRGVKHLCSLPNVESFAEHLDAKVERKGLSRKGASNYLNDVIRFVHAFLDSLGVEETELDGGPRSFAYRYKGGGAFVGRAELDSRLGALTEAQIRGLLSTLSLNGTRKVHNIASAVRAFYQHLQADDGVSAPAALFRSPPLDEAGEAREWRRAPAFTLLREWLAFVEARPHAHRLWSTSSRYIRALLASGGLEVSYRGGSAELRVGARTVDRDEFDGDVRTFFLDLTLARAIAGCESVARSNNRCSPNTRYNVYRDARVFFGWLAGGLNLQFRPAEVSYAPRREAKPYVSPHQILMEWNDHLEASSYTADNRKFLRMTAESLCDLLAAETQGSRRKAALPQDPNERVNQKLGALSQIEIYSLVRQLNPQNDFNWETRVRWALGAFFRWLQAQGRSNAVIKRRSPAPTTRHILPLNPGNNGKRRVAGD